MRGKFSSNILILMLMLPFSLSAQDLIGKSRTAVKQWNQKDYLFNDTTKFTLTETDSTLIFYVKDNPFQEKWIFEFDNNGLCKLESFHTRSLQQFTAARDKALRKKAYQWRSLNLNQYISKFEKNILLEMQETDKVYSISFIRTSLDKRLYDILVGND